jgi:hypothetical protein
MTNAEASDRIHHQSSVASQRPSWAVASAYQVGKIASPSRPPYLYGAARSFTQAAGLVESGDQVSRRIPADCLEFAIGPATYVIVRPSLVGQALAADVVPE